MCAAVPQGQLSWREETYLLKLLIDSRAAHDLHGNALNRRHINKLMRLE